MDLISRQEAIDAIKKNTFRLTVAEEQNAQGHVTWSAYVVYSDTAEGALLELPSAEPKTVCIAKVILSDEQIQEAVEKAKNEILQVFPTIEPEYEELTQEEVTSEIASKSVMSTQYWFDVMTQLENMGYVICRKR